MKRKHSYLLILIAITTITANSQTRDTIFIIREYNPSYHAVFIDTNRHSNSYSLLETYAANSFDSAFYFEGIKQLNGSNKIKKIRSDNIDKDWSPLYLYKKKYYVYLPSDGMYNDWIHISDSIFLWHAGGEMICNSIDSFKRIGNKQFQFSLLKANRHHKVVNIYILDKEKGIALFEYPGEKQHPFELKVATNKIRNFPMIVNYCKNEKQSEFEFDKIDFKFLLAQFNRKAR
jgi:hypothetical protein